MSALAQASICLLTGLLCSSAAAQSRPTTFYKIVRREHAVGDRVRPYYVKTALEQGASRVESVLHRAWKTHGAPRGLPARKDCLFAITQPPTGDSYRHVRRWRDEHLGRYLIELRPVDPKRVVVRDARHYSEAYQALEKADQYDLGTKERKRHIDTAQKAAERYWTKKPAGPKARPEVLIEGEAVTVGILPMPYE